MWILWIYPCKVRCSVETAMDEENEEKTKKSTIYKPVFKWKINLKMSLDDFFYFYVDMTYNFISEYIFIVHM